jgi:hypothetical protein
MRLLTFLITLAAALANAPQLAFAADNFPKFDIARNCKADATDATGTGQSLASCIHDEEQSRAELAERWDQFTKEDKVICIGEASIDGTPSYVELETCLEMVADNRARLKGKP